MLSPKKSQTIISLIQSDPSIVRYSALSDGATSVIWSSSRGCGCEQEPNLRRTESARSRNNWKFM